jgi:curved DNA-binding protein CbpA
VSDASTSVGSWDVLAACRLLRCRAGACPAEIRAAFRAAVRETRPDLGHSTAEELHELRRARDVLLANAGTDRRRHQRDARAYTNPTLLRRETWGLGDGGNSRVSSYL